MLRSLVIAVTAGVFATSAACEPPPPKAPESLALTVKVPKFSPVKEGTETQEREGVVVQMAPPLFSVERATALSCTEQATFMVTNDQYLFEIRETPSYAVTPENIVFNVKVTNRTDQVLKLEGTVFKLIVDDKEITLDQEAYKTFTSGILTPQQQKQFAITGPAWSSLADNATVSFSVFGMPIAIDEAGNVAKRGNFDWTFSYKPETQAKDEQVQIRQESMTRADAAGRCPNLGGQAAMGAR